MPDFRPFPALRYATDIDVNLTLAPPYDVLSDAGVEKLHDSNPYNITHIDVPEGHDYAHAAQLLRQWVSQGILVEDTCETLSIYRLKFTDESGRPHEILGVLGGLEVVDDVPGASVLPHERTTPKASTDRLELMRATSANTSPVWGLSLASGLTRALREPGEMGRSVSVDGVTHIVEQISDPDRISAIRDILASDDVLLADGHHRYGVSRIYRDEVRAATGRCDTRAEQTLGFVNELVEDQLCLEAIHRLYAGVSPEVLRTRLGTYFTFSPMESLSQAVLDEMVESGRLVLIWPDGTSEWLTPKPGVFDHVRNLDGAWLEAALAGIDADITYQHGLSEMMDCLATGDFTAGILIRPTSIEEIRRTAREGLLMPPKSTFFTPKLLTGWVVRPTEPLPR